MRVSPPLFLNPPMSRFVPALYLYGSSSWLGCLEGGFFSCVLFFFTHFLPLTLPAHIYIVLLWQDSFFFFLTDLEGILGGKKQALCVCMCIYVCAGGISFVCVCVLCRCLCGDFFEL